MKDVPSYLQRIPMPMVLFHTILQVTNQIFLCQSLPEIYIYIYIYIYICNIYSTLTGLIYKNIDPRFSVQGCDIARACEGYITSEDTKPRFYIVLYKNCKCTIYNILYADRLKIHRSIYKNIRPNHIKRLPW